MSEEFRAQALELYGAVWPHVPTGIQQARTWGSDWFEVSTPFTAEEDGRLVAHAGVIRCQLSFGGEARQVAAVHGVCVHPDYRSRGLARKVLEEALDHVDRIGLRTTILWSEKVDLYRRFDFEAVPEKVFRAPAPRGRRIHASRLNLSQRSDRERLRSVLERRRPVSGVAAAADPGWHFLIDLALWTEARDFLIHLPEHEAIVVAEKEGSRLHLYDVLAEEVPPAADLVGAAQTVLGGPIEEMDVYFTPDRLDLETEAAEHPIEDLFMVRGESLIDRSVGFALSPFTRT